MVSPSSHVPIGDATARWGCHSRTALMYVLRRQALSSSWIDDRDDTSRRAGQGEGDAELHDHRRQRYPALGAVLYAGRSSCAVLAMRRPSKRTGRLHAPRRSRSRRRSLCRICREAVRWAGGHGRQRLNHRLRVDSFPASRPSQRRHCGRGHRRRRAGVPRPVQQEFFVGYLRDPVEKKLALFCTAEDRPD